MLFTSGSYLIFLAIVFLLYWPLAAKRWVRVVFLLAASYYFYALWNPRFLAVLFLISTVDFFAARFCIGVDRRTRTDVGKIDRIGENRFRCARARIVNEPFDFCPRTDPLFKPAFSLAGKSMTHQPLYMGHIRKVADSDSRFRANRDHGSYRQEDG